MSASIGMEVVLAHQSETQISVTCHEQFSHSFDLRSLHLKDEKALLDRPERYGKTLYAALFPQGTLAQQTHLAGCERIVLVATEERTFRRMQLILSGLSGSPLQEAFQFWQDQRGPIRTRSWLHRQKVCTESETA